LPDNGKPDGLPDEILTARRSLERLKFVQVTDEFEWNETYKRWTLGCTVTVDTSDVNLVPETTRWFALISTHYPWGTIKFYPATIGGITHTFYHQNYNGPLSHLEHWSTGSPCLDTTNKNLDRVDLDFEPYASEQRLKWHFRRLTEWLQHASAGTLVTIGDPFELPEFPGSSSTKGRLVFLENESTFEIWKTAVVSSGTFRYFYMFEDKELRKTSNPIVIREFMDHERSPIFENEWGTVFPSEDQKGNPYKTETGIWILAPDIPVISPWQAPTTWLELNKLFNTYGRDLLQEISRGASKLRNGIPLIIAIGFRIPKNFGGNPTRIHWQGILLGPLSRGGKHAPGFRANEQGYWINDLRTHFFPTKPVLWLRSQNWADEEIRNRGRLAVDLRNESIAIIGAGALGSAISDILVRSGAKRILVLDPEMIDVGNLSRHNLSLADIGFSKAERLQHRLQHLSPNVVAESIESSFPPSNLVDQDNLRSCKIVIDCTGSDQALEAISTFPWLSEKLFFSASIGANADHLFLFRSRADKFPVKEMRLSLSPWLQIERETIQASPFPREHTGCWHAVFPARADDLLVAAAAAIKIVEASMSLRAGESELVVLKKISENFSTGYRPADSPGNEK
jgi:hypothetical protein